MPHAPVSYVDPPDIPAGMTLGEYRLLQARPRRRLRRRLLRVSGLRTRSLRAAPARAR